LRWRSAKFFLKNRASSIKKSIPQIYLFDIDGTLISARGAGTRAFHRAVRDHLGLELDWHARQFAGATDAGLISEAFKVGGIDFGYETITAFKDRYHAYLAENLCSEPPLVHAGVDDLVRRLTREHNAHVGLLTGNTERGSQIKLAENFEKFGFGFFGDEHTLRNELSCFARRELEKKFGEDIEVTIIGDTPNDIACARAAGMRCVAVATGLYTVGELAGADRVLASLAEWHDGENSSRAIK